MVYFVCHMRRVNCPQCGVKVERVPWAEGKSSLTTEYSWFLARWARRMSWKEVAEAFHVSWDRVYDAVKQAVSWGLVPPAASEAMWLVYAYNQNRCRRRRFAPGCCLASYGGELSEATREA
jgi:hypothetical protein